MIAKYGSSRDFYRLQLASIDTAWEVRSSVAGAFGSLRLARSAKRLAEMLRIDHHFIVRRDAAEALAVVNANAEGILRDCLVNEKDNIVQSSIYRALYMLGDRAVLSKILLYLNDDDSLVRTNVVNGLRFTGVDENDHELVIRALDALLLTETHPGVREDASVFRSELETFGAEYLPKDFVK
jgi:HEAT repeat protein